MLIIGRVPLSEVHKKTNLQKAEQMISDLEIEQIGQGQMLSDHEIAIRELTTEQGGIRNGSEEALTTV